MIKFRRLKSPRKGECMSCGNDRVRFVDSDGSEFCSKNCVTDWHGEIPEVKAFPESTYDKRPREFATPFVIYVCANDAIGVTPDGIGFYWFDSVQEAQDEMGMLDVRYIDFVWED